MPVAPTYDATNKILYIAGGAALSTSSLASATGTPGSYSSVIASSVDDAIVAGGHLFYSSSLGIFDAGAEPTGSVGSPKQLSGVDTGSSVKTSSSSNYTDGSPQTFFFANLGSGNNWNGTGFDTLYIIDTQGSSKPGDY